MAKTDGKNFSYCVSIQSVPINMKIEANGLDCQKLAEEWDVLSVDNLCADVKLSSWKKGGIRLSGKVCATIVQACVITLDRSPSITNRRIFRVYFCAIFVKVLVSKW